MAPVRMNLDSKEEGLLSKKCITTRSQSITITNKIGKIVHEKRKADCSPLKKKTNKRSAFVDITNAREQMANPIKKVITKKAQTKVKDDRLGSEKPGNAFQRKPVAKVVKPANPSIKAYGKLTKPTSMLMSKTAVKSKGEHSAKELPAKVVGEIESTTTRASSGSSDNSLYVSAVEEMTNVSLLDKQTEVINHSVEAEPKSEMPPGVDDFDAENWTDPIMVSTYAMDIFNYLKEREVAFSIDDYMVRQVQLNHVMRSLLVDWMVEVQESFELNHETLYLAVKLVDLYLVKNSSVPKETLQLVGAAAIFIASKYDERMPPLVEDFLYICDGAYTKVELIQMEKNVIQAVDCNLGIPLSYRFLRRYARCAKVSMATLTLSRYILEMSLMEYSLVTISDSKLAAAALLLALRMKDISSWTPTLQYYSGYKLSDIKDVTHSLNTMLHKKPKETLKTIRNKYSHRIFFEVATLPLLSNVKM